MKKVIVVLMIIGFISLIGYGIYYRFNMNIVMFKDIPVNKSDNKKDILLVHPNLLNSGALVMLHNLATILKKKNYSVYLLIFNDKKNVTYFEDLNIPVVKVDRKFFRTVKTQELKMFDLLIWNTYANYQKWLENRHRFKSILWLHEMFTDLDGKLYYTNSTLDKCLNNDEQKSYRNKVVTVSNLAYCNAQKRIPIVTEDNIIYNFIDEKVMTKISDKKFDKKLKENNKNKIVFSMIGRIEPDKKQDIFIKAINLLPEEYKNKSFFYIVGDIENEKYAKSLKINKLHNVKLVENVPYKKMGVIYANTNVLLHPSQIDASPLVINEAAANNIPAVITNNTGSTHIIKDGESGFVIPVGDAEALKEKIIWFIDNPEQIEVMGEKANQYYKETSSKEIFEEKWLQLINKVLTE